MFFKLLFPFKSIYYYSSNNRMPKLQKKIVRLKQMIDKNDFIRIKNIVKN